MTEITPKHARTAGRASVALRALPALAGAAFAFALLSSAVVGDVHATEVYVNGVRADLIEPVKVEGCTIEIRDDGSVHVITPRNALVVDSIRPTPATLPGAPARPQAPTVEQDGSRR